MKAWLTDLRKTALVAMLIQLPVVIIALDRPDVWGSLAKVHGYFVFVFALIGVVALAVFATFVLFMVALYRSSAPLRIPRRLRLLALVAAVVNVMPLLTYSYRWIHFFLVPALFQQPASFRSMIQAAIILASGTAYTLFLVALALHQDDSAERQVSGDKLLRRLALIGTIVWGVILVCILLTEPYLAVQYSGWRELALERRVSIPPLSSMLWERFQDWVKQALLFVPFYIVHKSLVTPTMQRASTPDAAGFDTPENPADRA